MQREFPAKGLRPRLFLSVEAYELDLAWEFGTSHSSTKKRSNALLTLQVGDFSGFGECGLPPKKPHCYLANYDDVTDCFTKYLANLSSSLSEYKPTIAPHKSFNEFPEPYFNLLRNSSVADSIKKEYSMLHFLVEILDRTVLKPEQRVFRNAFELALFDIFGKLLKVPVYKLIGIDTYIPKPSFYTAALNDDISKIMESAKCGLEHTAYIKVKLNHEVERGEKILAALNDLYKSRNITKYKWTIDANAAWSVDTAMAYLDVIEKYKDVLYMVEQPFSVVVKDEDVASWIKVKEAYGKLGVLIYADETVSTSADVERLKDFVHGVNIKLDKTGGYREAIRAVIAARKANLKVWFGMMVASRLSTTATAHMLPLADLGGDLDGSILIKEYSNAFIGGMSWHSDGVHIEPSVGLCLKKKPKKIN